MRSNDFTYRAITIIIALGLLSFYGLGCGGDDDDDDILVMDDPTDQPPDNEPPGDQPPDEEPPGAPVSYSADIQPILTVNGRKITIACYFFQADNPEFTTVIPSSSGNQPYLCTAF